MNPRTPHPTPSRHSESNSATSPGLAPILPVNPADSPATISESRRAICSGGAGERPPYEVPCFLYMLVMRGWKPSHRPLRPRLPLGFLLVAVGATSRAEVLQNEIL